MLCCWDDGRSLIISGWVAWASGYDVEGPETSDDPRLRTSLMTHPGASKRCILQNELLYYSVTSGNRPDGNRGTVLVTTGETVDSTERRQPGQVGLAPQLVSFVRKNLKFATSTTNEAHPQGIPRGGENEIPIRTDQRITTNANDQRTMTVKCSCGKQCKNPRGLKIHQARMKCLDKGSPVKRSGSLPGETQEEHGQDTPHSAQSLHSSDQANTNRSIQKRVKWPPANDKIAWQQFDEDVCGILQTTSKGAPDRRLQTMSTIIVSYASERFGLVKTDKNNTTYNKNRRANTIQELRKQLRTLRKQHKQASEEERQPLAELREILRTKLKSIRRAEGHRRRRRERARKRTSFISNPFNFTRKLLGDRRSGQLVCSAEEVNCYLSKTLSDPAKEKELGQNKCLITPAPPTSDFDLREPAWKEIQEVVRAARSASAPGPSGVTYCVYKRCPGLLHYLWKVIRVVWRRGRVADQWRCAEGVWVPKEENSRDIEQFRSISLLSVESKIFFSILSRRLASFLLNNKYIDTSVQKGGIAGMPGCLEHTGVLTQLLREAKEGRGDLVVLWLDFANAYGSIPHKLVEEALTRHHVPSRIRELILDYYNNFQMRISSGSVTSDWHRLERGIITGCTISATLFALAMNMIVKSAEVECRGPIMKTGVRQPPIRAYMDDLTVTTSSVPGCRWILRGLEKLISWARMSLKPSKSRSVVLKKGKVVNKYRFTVAGTVIPTLSEKPVKSLGKIFNCTLKDTSATREASIDLEAWLNKVDKSGLPGRFKAWIYQHAVLPRILWPLLIYDVPMSTVEALERKISGYLRRWLGLPRGLSSVALYGTSNALQLPFKGLSEEFMVSRTRETMQYRDSKDPKVSAAGVEVRTGRKWSATKELQVAEERLRQRALVGTVAKGRAGLGFFPSTRYDKTRGKERHHLLQEEVRAGVEEERRSKMVGLSQQGAWTRWENTLRRKVTWSDFWRADFYNIRFLVQSVYDTLPSPANLHIWGKSDTPSCPLCVGRGSLQHILSGCPRALSDGRYRWRHDQVLGTIADIFTSAIRASSYNPKKKKINFVRAGENPPSIQKTKACLLSTAPDWQLRVDLGSRLKFPEQIISTTLRPDMVMFSESTKHVTMWELTVPWEGNMEEAHERKLAKYQELVENCRFRGWRASCYPIEVGCRGFSGSSLCKSLTGLGLTGAQKRKALKEITKSAERASKWLWIKRASTWNAAA